MKNFKVCNHNLKNWKNISVKNATQVVSIIKTNKSFENTDWEVSWKTPVTGEYVTIIEKHQNKIKINTNFKMPRVFLKLI